MDDGWQFIQATKKGFDLNKIFNEEFLKKLEENFENENINVINVGIALINKDISPEEDDSAEQISLIELGNKTIEDTFNDNIHVIVSNPKSMSIIQKIIDDF